MRTEPAECPEVTRRHPVSVVQNRVIHRPCRIPLRLSLNQITLRVKRVIPRVVPVAALWVVPTSPPIRGETVGGDDLTTGAQFQQRRLREARLIVQEEQLALNRRLTPPPQTVITVGGAQVLCGRRGDDLTQAVLGVVGKGGSLLPYALQQVEMS